MKLRSMAWFAAAGLAAASAPALADDFDWSGFYAGAQIGYEWGDADHSFEPGVRNIPPGDSEPDGIAGGVHAGYLHQADALAFGIEADFETADVEGSFINTAASDSTGATGIEMQGSVRARLGWATGRWLPYITGGLALASVEYRGGNLAGPCCGFDRTPLGYTAGGGLEYVVSDKVSARLEYRFTDFGEESGALVPAFSIVTMPVELETHALRFGVSVRF